MEFLRRYWWLLSMIALVIGFALLTPHQAQYDAANPYAYEETANQAPNNEPWDMTLIAAVTASGFTGLLAIIGMVQVFDTKRSNERQLRAYVFLSEADVVVRANKKLGLQYEVTMKIKNFGQTPAYKVRQQIGFRIPTELDIPLSGPEEIFDQQYSVGPGGHHETTISKEVAEVKSAAERTNSPKGLFIVGRIDYLDAFGRDRRTPLKFEVRQHGPTGEYDLRPCGDGNDAT